MSCTFESQLAILLISSRRERFQNLCLSFLTPILWVFLSMFSIFVIEKLKFCGYVSAKIIFLFCKNSFSWVELDVNNHVCSKSKVLAIQKQISTFPYEPFNLTDTRHRRLVVATGKCGLIIRKSDLAKIWQILSDSNFKCDLQTNVFEPVE